MVTADRLDPFPSVAAGGVTFLVDASRPAAALIGAEGSVRVVTWADAPLPARAASGRTLAATGCLWVVYNEDFAETDPTPTVTAVRIGADAQAAACVLGSPEVIGVDDVGVWLTAHPYLAVNPDLGREHLDAAVLDEPPERVENVPIQSREDFERDQEEAGRADVEAAMAAAAVAAGDEQPTGWFACSPDAHRQPPLAPAPAPRPTAAAVLRRVSPGGVEEMAVSRVVSQVAAPAPGVLHLVFHPTTAVITNTPDGHGRTYDHPRRLAVLDVSRGLPARVDLDALDSQPFEEQPPTWPARGAGDRVDLSGVDATRWTLRRPDQDEIDSAVQAVRAQYEALDAPHVVHTRSDDRWHRVRSRYADLAVRVEGAWPLTEVVTDFTVHTRPADPLRRRTRVFDDAGLPIANPYLAIRLDEDLAEAEADLADLADLAEMPTREGRQEI